jgi:IclR family KDG regulon transcriptional repressor
VNNTLVKGFAVLEALAYAKRPLGVTELAHALGLGKSNVHRLLQALTELGYAHRDEATSSYRASIRLWELGSAVLERIDLRGAAASYMERLLQQTRETVHLSILDGDEVVYVHKLDSPEPVRAYTRVGGRAPAWCVATGKAMLAWQGEAALAALADRIVRHSPNTIVEPAEFLREMERVRRKGYAVNRGEWRESVCGLAAPVRDPGERVVAAIGISGPADRLRQSSFKATAPLLIEAAQGIGRALAGAEPQGAAASAKPSPSAGRRGVPGMQAGGRIEQEFS